MFFRTMLRGSGRAILINIDHIENVYEDHDQATIVMLPAGQERQRVFETSCPFGEAVRKLTSVEIKDAERPRNE